MVESIVEQAGKLSPSPRRAWIEISAIVPKAPCIAVALPTEGVDRNWGYEKMRKKPNESPSPRRAWIEITSFLKNQAYSKVALPTEGVDRNITARR